MDHIAQHRPLETPKPPPLISCSVKPAYIHPSSEFILNTKVFDEIFTTKHFKDNSNFGRLKATRIRFKEDDPES